MLPSQATTPSTASGSGADASASIDRPMTRLTIGPAIAIRSSAPAEGNRPLNLATPPNSQRTIPSISIPSRRATTAWPSSCRSSEVKNRTAAIAAIAM